MEQTKVEIIIDQESKKDKPANKETEISINQVIAETYGAKINTT